MGDYLGVGVGTWRCGACGKVFEGRGCYLPKTLQQVQLPDESWIVACRGCAGPRWRVSDDPDRGKGRE